MHRVEFSEGGWVHMVFLKYYRKTGGNPPVNPTRCQVLSVVLFKSPISFLWGKSLGYKVQGAGNMPLGLLFMSGTALIIPLSLLAIGVYNLIASWSGWYTAFVFLVGLAIAVFIVLISLAVFVASYFVVLKLTKLPNAKKLANNLKDAYRLFVELIKQVKDGSFICPFVAFTKKN